MPTPIRYKFDKARATTLFPLIEEANDTNAWGRVSEALDLMNERYQLDLAKSLDLASFDPADGAERAGTVNDLISLAWTIGLLTGPSEPHYENTPKDGMCLVAYAVPFGDQRLTLALDWQEVGDLAGYHRGADAALAMLGRMTDQMNRNLETLDAYVPTMRARPVCTVEDAHCEDCGGREIAQEEGVVVCEDCGGDLTNPDDCVGAHLSTGDR